MAIENFEQFLLAVNKLVQRWEGSDEELNVAPRETLQAIWQEVREQAVHDLAQMQRERDDAVIALHRRYLLEAERTRR
jgi:hypothetical protein